MSAPRFGAVVAAHVADAQALLRNLTATVPKTQVLREIPFNAIQACQRAIAAGAREGRVVIDYVTTPAGVRKLRIWDTGDGMSPAELFDRIGAMSTQARTETNFGIGAKLSLTKVSPHGVIYQTLRDGKASQARWQQNADTGAWGLAVLNPNGTTDAERSVIPADPAHLPEEVRAAGHGTAVTILGVSADDDTTWSLRPDGTTSKRWLLEVLNDRFTQVPDGIHMRVVMPGVENGGLDDDDRQVIGSAGHLKYYTRDRAGSSDPTNGARGKVRIAGPVPATAYWWVLPETTNRPPSYMRIGGKVRVVTDGEVYGTYGATHLNAAGVWTKAARVEIHFVPDSSLDVRPDVQRTTLTLDGAPLPVLEWCEEFKRSMPAAIKTLLAGTTKDRAATDFSEELASMNARYSATRVVRRRGPRTTEVDPVGELTSERGRAGAREREAGQGVGGALVRLLRGRPATSRAKVNSPGLSPVVQLAERTGRGTRMATTTVAPAIPTTSWINENGLGDDPDLGDLAARYIAADNHLVINAAGATYRRVIATFTAEYRDVPGAAPEIEHQVRRFLTRAMQDTIIGARRDFPATWEEMVTPSALSMRMAALYDTDARLRQVFARKGWRTGVVVEDDTAESAA